MPPCGSDLFHYDTPCDGLSLCSNLLLINRLLTAIRFIPASRKPVAFLIVCLPGGDPLTFRGMQTTVIVAFGEWLPLPNVERCNVTEIYHPDNERA